VVLLISYDLRGRERPAAYDAVRQAIERHAISFRRPLYSQWLVETGEDVDTWSERLGRVADADDRWLVVRVLTPYQGWLPGDIWEWLRQRT
jgi:hypothetical protein